MRSLHSSRTMTEGDDPISNRNGHGIGFLMRSARDDRTPDNDIQGDYMVDWTNAS